MKTTNKRLHCLVLLLCTTITGSAVAQSGWSVVQRGLDYKVLQMTSMANGSNCVHRITVLATGLSYTNASGQLVESSEQITVLPDGTAAATQGQHTVKFPADINNGVLQVTTPDGQCLYSRPLCVCYDDGSNTVVIATLTNSVGYLTASNEVTYPNCFSGGIKADLVARYRRGAFECDLVVRARPVAPDASLDPAFTTLQLVTEFFNTQDPEQMPAASDERYGLSDSTLKFGTMAMERGVAFAFNNLNKNSGSATLNPQSAVPVYKSWVHADGRTFLVEQVPLAYVAGDLNALPLTASIQRPATSVQHLASLLLYTGTAPNYEPAPSARHFSSRHPQFPLSHGRITDTNRILLAAADFGKKRGVVLDYVIVNGYQNTPTIFESGVTYFISGPLYCYNVTLQGSAVIKFPNDRTAFIEVVGDPVFACQTSPYKPAIFTAADDISVGEDVGDAWAGHGGVIQPGGYANPALRFDDHVGLHDVRIAYAQEAISAWSGANIGLTNLQIINCEVGVDLWGSDNYTGYGGPGAILNNCLIVSPDPNHAGSDALSGGGNNALYSVWNCTIDSFSVLMGTGDDGSGAGTIDGENSVFADISDFGGGGLYGYGDSMFWNTPGTFSDGGQMDYYYYPFIQVGGGAYYLNPNASLPYSGSSLPVDYSNQTINSDTTFGPQPYNSGIGYSYPRLDYLFDQTTVSANLTFQAGTIAGWQGQGLSFSGNYTMTFNGTGPNPCYFVPCEAVQEQSGSGTGVTDANGSDGPTVSATFVRFWALDSQATFIDASSINLTADNCEFISGQLGGNVTGGLSLTLFNCLLDNSLLYMLGTPSSPACWLMMQNCTSRGGMQYVLREDSNANNYWSINVFDSAFDGTQWSLGSSFQQTINWDYNATNEGSSYPASLQGSHDIGVTSFNWQAGPVGDFYLPSNSPLIDKGNTTADQTALNDFTTQVSQTIEGFSLVDIGYHYAVNGPVANPQVVNMLLNTAQNIMLTGIDPNLMSLNFTLLSYPTHGTLSSGAIPMLVYTPNSPTYVGPDSFTFKVDNGTVTSSPATISINVLASDNGPYIYPLTPGTAGWDSVTPEQRIQANNIPQSWLAGSTSWDLFLSVIQNPYFKGICMANDINNGYNAAMLSPDLAVLNRVDSEADFGLNTVRWLEGISPPALLTVQCANFNGPCWMDYVVVCYMAGRNSAITTMDQATMQKLFRLAIWDADYFDSQSDDFPAAAAVQLAYTIYNLPDNVRGTLPAGVTLPTLSSDETFQLSQEIVPSDIAAAIDSAKAALGLTARP